MAKTTKTTRGNASGTTAATATAARTNGGGDRIAFARRPENIGQMEVARPQNGAEYIESLRDGREVFIYGERVKDVTTHPAFRNTARAASSTSPQLTPERTAATAACCASSTE